MNNATVNQDFKTRCKEYFSFRHIFVVSIFFLTNPVGVHLDPAVLVASEGIRCPIPEAGKALVDR